MPKVKFILFISFTILIVMTTKVYAGKWYEGGTLHKETAQNWHGASYQDRLATSADFVTIAAPKLSQDYLFSNNMEPLKERSKSLEACISEATNATELASMKISEVAAVCLIFLK